LSPLTTWLLHISEHPSAKTLHGLIRKGDSIKKVDDEPVTNSHDFYFEKIAKLAPGTTVSLTLGRSVWEEVVDVVVVEMPPSDEFKDEARMVRDDMLLYPLPSVFIQEP